MTKDIKIFFIKRLRIWNCARDINHDILHVTSYWFNTKHKRFFVLKLEIRQIVHMAALWYSFSLLHILKDWLSPKIQKDRNGT